VGVEYIDPLVGQTDPAMADEQGTGLGQPCQVRCGTGLSDLAAPKQMGGEVGSGGGEGKGQRHVGHGRRSLGGDWTVSHGRD
jgi:hypothetical protein